MASPEIRRNAVAIAALVMPVLAVKITTIALGQPSIQQASAEPKPVAAATAAAVVAKARSFSSQQIAAMQYIQTLRAQPFGPAPIRAENVAPVATQPIVTPAQPDPDSTSTIGPVPQFTLTAVMSTNGIVSGSDGTVSVQPTRRALINERPYREGEMVKGTTWKIARIDCDKRSVTLRDTQSDRAVTVNVELPQ
jgi:hypothetical protein